jgi:signal transduction histidine kinase
VPIIGSVAGQALTQRAPVVCGPDVAERYPASGAFFRGGIETTMVCVIEGQDQALGVIGVHARHRRVFTRDDEMFVQTLGNVIAAAIMRQRAERALQDAEEAERRRIAEAVHDDTLQVMIAVALRLETLQRSSGDEDVRAKVGLLVEDTRLAAGRLRSLAFDLYPEDLGQGLEVVVRRLLADTAMDAGFCYELVTDLPKAPPILAARTLYRNIAEAVVNVRKHARASRVVVEIMADEDGTTARVTDDGVGIAAVAASGGAHGHLGLKGLRERTTRAGGRIRIEAGAEGGTVVELWVPNTPLAHGG